MFLSIKQFVPSKVCLSCDGCCRFKDETSPWRPKIGEGEKDRVDGLGLADRVLKARAVGSDGYLKTVACGGSRLCSFFAPSDGTCRVHTEKPFECSLYPFLLSRTPEGTALFVHLNCPFVQETRSTPAFREYAEYLREFFGRAETKDFLRKNLSLIGDYAGFADEMEEMFPISL